MKRSNILMAILLLVIIIFPASYVLVSNQFNSEQKDAQLLKRLTFINGSVQRYIKLPEHPQSLAADIDTAFSSAENLYPSLTDASVLSMDYRDLKRCWNSIERQTKLNPNALKELSEICWLKANKTIFDLQFIIDTKRKHLMNTLYFLGVLAAFSLGFLMFQIFRYVRSGLEMHQKVDLESGLYNANAFLEECTREAIASIRARLPLSILLIKLPAGLITNATLKPIQNALTQSCRREEKLFRISDNGFALITFNTRSDNLEPLINRLEKNLKDAMKEKKLVYVTKEFDRDEDAEAFGASCLLTLDRLKA